MVFKTSFAVSNVTSLIFEEVLLYFYFLRNFAMSGLLAYLNITFDSPESLYILPFQLYVIISFAGTAKALVGLANVSLF